MNKKFRDSLNERLKDPEFSKEWKDSEVEYQIIKAIIECREEKQLTQKDLSDITGITQSDISKLENGNANPSIKTLTKIASAFDKTLEINFK